MTLEGIKDAIAHLSADDRCELERWLAIAWDSEIETDFSPGEAGMSVREEVDAHIDAGNFAPFKVTRPRG